MVDQLTHLIRRIQLLSVEDRKPIIKYLDELDKLRQPTSRDRGYSSELEKRITYFRQLNEMGPLSGGIVNVEGRREYDDLLVKYLNGTITRQQANLLWVLDYRFGKCVTKDAKAYRARQRIATCANGMRSSSKEARRNYESTPLPT